MITMKNGYMKRRRLIPENLQCWVEEAEAFEGSFMERG